MSYETELSFAKDLAQEAGKIMLNAKELDTEWKQDNSPVTVADTAINNLVIDRVKASFPGHAVIGEEASYPGTDPDKVWVVDPIDGTKAFMADMPLSVFSMALVDRHDGQPVMGVTFEPVRQQLYEATKDDGAFMNGEAIRTSEEGDLNRAFISVYGSRQAFNEDSSFSVLRTIKKIRQQGATHFSAAAFVYFATKIASGEFAGSVMDYGNPWDAAAAAIIVREAGGVVTDIEGQPRRFDENGNGIIMAANQTMHAQLLSVVSDQTP